MDGGASEVGERRSFVVAVGRHYGNDVRHAAVVGGPVRVSVVVPRMVARCHHDQCIRIARTVDCRIQGRRSVSHVPGQNDHPFALIGWLVTRGEVDRGCAEIRLGPTPLAAEPDGQDLHVCRAGGPGDADAVCPLPRQSHRSPSFRDRRRPRCRLSRFARATGAPQVLTWLAAIPESTTATIAPGGARADASPARRDSEVVQGPLPGG